MHPSWHTALVCIIKSIVLGPQFNWLFLENSPNSRSAMSLSFLTSHLEICDEGLPSFVRNTCAIHFQSRSSILGVHPSQPLQ